jgi:hypothetical protein
MNDYYIINGNINLSYIQLGIRRNSGYLSIKYNKRAMYIQTPEVVLSSIEQSKDKAYIALYINDNDFIDTINALDNYLCNKTWENRNYLGLSDSNIAAYKNYVPTFGLSRDTKCMRFQIDLNTIDVYDENGEKLPAALIKPEHTGKGLIYIKGLKRSGGYYSLDMELKQIKIIEPELVFDECLLSYIDESE